MPRSLRNRLPDPLRRHWLTASALACLGVRAQAQELSDLDKVRASGVLKVAVYKDNAPYSDGTAQNLRGVDVALAQALADTMGLKLSLLPFDAGERMDDDLRNMVWKGHYLGYGPADVMLHVPVDKFLIRETPQSLIFAPYSREVLVVFHALDKLSGLKSGDDLQDLPLAAERGSGAAGTLLGYGGGRLRAKLTTYPTGVQAAEAVIRGEAAAAYLSRAQAEAALHASGRPASGFGFTQLTLPGLADNGWPIGMAVKANHKMLAQALETALGQVRQSGKLLAIYREHGLTLVAP
ncbi:substrate-binding periplasmic protein [Limnohabitans radicicola]|uniref:Transporter substrate-binding domain-containing protein n=1 Tax=Limnohabitans radicicola TaxID=2771427 RepID=A0A927IIP6_9BURK|nr:transporter substrate-binding domain-containing protein [Limnohabitans radicicola]MBD8049849.1 transporter substrate-binding domain-containing protein [Limnohabitans radicicola]